MPQPKNTTHKMYPLVESYLEGHLTQKAFCAKHGISESVLNYWLSKYRGETAEPAEAFIEITPRAVSERALMEINYPHGVCLRLFTPVEPSYLKHLLAPGRRKA